MVTSLHIGKALKAQRPREDLSVVGGGGGNKGGSALPFFISGNPALKSQNWRDGQIQKNILALQATMWREVTLPRSRGCRIFQGKNIVEGFSSKPSFRRFSCGGFLLTGLVFNGTSAVHVSFHENLQCYPSL